MMSPPPMSPVRLAFIAVLLHTSPVLSEESSGGVALPTGDVWGSWSRFLNIDRFRRSNGSRCYRMGGLAMFGCAERAGSNRLVPTSKQKDRALQLVTTA
jgi:hypothetical protein